MQFIYISCINAKTEAINFRNLVILNFLEDFLLVRVCLMKTSSLHTNTDNSKVPGRFTRPGSLIML